MDLQWYWVTELCPLPSSFSPWSPSTALPRRPPPPKPLPPPPDDMKAPNPLLLRQSSPPIRNRSLYCCTGPPYPYGGPAHVLKFPFQNLLPAPAYIVRPSPLFSSPLPPLVSSLPAQNPPEIAINILTGRKAPQDFLLPLGRRSVRRFLAPKRVGGLCKKHFSGHCAGPKRREASMAKKRRIFKILDGGIAPDRVEKTASQAAPPNAPTPFARQEMLPGHKKKKKGSRNASSRSPPQERQPEERLTTAAWLRAFLHRYLRHLPGWLLRVFRLAVTDTTATGAPGFSETAPTTRGADQALPAGPPEEKKAIAIRQARLYEAPLHNSARHQRNQRESTTQLLDRPRPTMEQIYEEYTKTVDPFEFEGNHRQYQIMRDSIKSTTFDKDICFVCYIEQTHRRSKPVPISNRNMDRHFEQYHFELGKVRCRHCEAMFPTRHLEWHTLHCHP